jgi:hypothetical protein
MSLFESGDSTGEVSLAALLDGPPSGGLGTGLRTTLPVGADMEGRAGIDEGRHPFSGQHLAPLFVAAARLFTTACLGQGVVSIELIEEALVVSDVCFEIFRSG